MSDVNDITIANTNEANAESNANAGGSGAGVNIVLSGAGVFVGVAILLAALYLILGRELFLSVLFWLSAATGLAIVIGLAIWYHLWSRKRLKSEIVEWIRIGAQVGVDVLTSSVGSQAEMHKAAGQITTEVIRTMRSNGAFDPPPYPMLSMSQPNQLTDGGQVVDATYEIGGIGDDDKWQ